jgi:hypothetical protein
MMMHGTMNVKSDVPVLIYLNILGFAFGSKAELSSKQGKAIYFRQKASLLQLAVHVPPTVIQAAVLSHYDDRLLLPTVAKGKTY